MVYKIVIEVDDTKIDAKKLEKRLWDIYCETEDLPIKRIYLVKEELIKVEFERGDVGGD